MRKPYQDPDADLKLLESMHGSDVQLQTLIDEVRTLRSEVSRYRDMIASMEGGVNSMEGQIFVLKRENAKLQKELNAARRSE